MAGLKRQRRFHPGEQFLTQRGVLLTDLWWTIVALLYLALAMRRNYYEHLGLHWGPMYRSKALCQLETTIGAFLTATPLQNFLIQCLAHVDRIIRLQPRSMMWAKHPRYNHKLRRGIRTAFLFPIFVSQLVTLEYANGCQGALICGSDKCRYILPLFVLEALLLCALTIALLFVYQRAKLSLEMEGEREPEMELGDGNEGEEDVVEAGGGNAGDAGMRGWEDFEALPLDATTEQAHALCRRFGGTDAEVVVYSMQKLSIAELLRPLLYPEEHPGEDYSPVVPTGYLSFFARKHTVFVAPGTSDVGVDALGQIHRKRRNFRRFKVTSPNGQLTTTRVTSKDEDEDAVAYIVVRDMRYAENLACSKTVVHVEGADKKMDTSKAVVISYAWDKGQDPKPWQSKPHGNCKTEQSEVASSPYVRKSQSSVTKKKAELVGALPHQVARDDDSGLDSDRRNSFSIRQLQRLRQDLGDKRTNRQPQGRKRESVDADLLGLCTDGSFVRRIEFVSNANGANDHKDTSKVPERGLRILLMTDDQRDLFLSFCTKGQRNFKQLLFLDTTFKVCPAYVTPLVAPCPMFKNGDGTSVTAILGYFIHTNRRASDYRWMANAVLEVLEPVVRKPRCHGYVSDDDDAIRSGLDSSPLFSEAQKLGCGRHYRQAVDRRMLTKLKVKDGQLRSKILASIFGREQFDKELGTMVRQCAIVDMTSLEEMSLGIQRLQPKWADLLESPANASALAEYISRSLLPKLAETYTPDIRTLDDAGTAEGAVLRRTSNRCEVVNWVIKANQNFRQVSIAEFIGNALRITTAQLKRFRGAMLGTTETGSRSRSCIVVSREYEKDYLAPNLLPPNKRRLFTAKLFPSDGDKTLVSLSVQPEDAEIPYWPQVLIDKVFAMAAEVIKGTVAVFPAVMDRKAYSIRYDDNYCSVSVSVEEQGDMECQSGDGNRGCNTFIFHGRLFCHHTIGLAEMLHLLPLHLLHIKGAISQPGEKEKVQRTLMYNRAGKKGPPPAEPKGARTATAVALPPIEEDSDGDDDRTAIPPVEEETSDHDESSMTLRLIEESSDWEVDDVAASTLLSTPRYASKHPRSPNSSPSSPFHTPSHFPTPDPSQELARPSYSSTPYGYKSRRLQDEDNGDMSIEL